MEVALTSVDWISQSFNCNFFTGIGLSLAKLVIIFQLKSDSEVESICLERIHGLNMTLPSFPDKTCGAVRPSFSLLPMQSKTRHF
jgi:hypothetical protein